MQKDTAPAETKAGTCDGDAPSTESHPVTSINQVEDQCNNFLLDLNKGQRVTEASPEQRVGATLCRMRDLNTLLSRLILALDRQIVEAATDTVKLQHLMRLQQNTTQESIRQTAQIAHEVAERALDGADPTSKGDVDYDDNDDDADADADDDASGSSDARVDVSPSKRHDVAGTIAATGDPTDGKD